MQTIILDQNWRYFIAEDDTPYHSPVYDDSAWLNVTPPTLFSPLLPQQILWLRCHFDMPPNDECSYWWLELTQDLPAETHIWVNYEKLPLPSEFSPAKWDMTYAIAMGDNVVTLQVKRNILPSLGEGMHCVPYPCD